MPLRMPTVLVVEDEPLIRMTLSDFLEEKGYRVLEAGCVLEAIAILGAQQIDGLVTDIDMPGGLSGIHLAWLMDRTRTNLAMIVVSGGSNPAMDEIPASVRFFQKPYKLDDIASALSAMVASDRTALKNVVA